MVLRWASIDDVPPGTISLLTDAERARLDALHRPEDRARLLAGHVLARLAVATELGVDPTEVEVRQSCRRCAGAHGQPAVWVQGRPGPHASISHAGRLAVAAIGDGPLGVDVEPRHTPDATIEAIASVALTERERSLVDGLAGALRRATILRLWMRKESIAKARGTGLLTDPARLDVGVDPKVLVPPEAGSPVGEVFRLVDLDLDVGHLAVLATVGGRAPTVELRRVDWSAVSSPAVAGRAGAATP